jgi:hypothetical protein
MTPQRRSTDHQDNIEECKNIFVSWAWLTAGIVGFIIVCCGGIYAYKSDQAIQDQEIQDLKHDLSDIKTAYIRHSNDMDTLKSILKTNYNILIKQQHNAIKDQR